ncbi:MAG: malto-oligosyltrehalose synthase [Pseudomonadota bacterium]
MNTNSSALQALARHCGIADEYTDVWGEAHPTSDATRRALLTAMHLPIDTEDPARILAMLLEEAWRQPVPPVCVCPADRPIEIDITLPTQHQQRWQWTLQREDGTTRNGEFHPEDLVYRETCRLASADFVRHRLVLPAERATGYHRFVLHAPAGKDFPMPLIVVPPACFQPAAIAGEGRVWGPAVQLYGLRSRRNWGIGDFTDLINLVDQTADAGGGIVGVNPLHALFPDQPAHFSPYSPSSRCGLNIQYLDIEAMPEFHECRAAQEHVASPAFQQHLRALRAGDLIDYPAIAAAKEDVLRILWRHFAEQHLACDSERAQDFRRYRAAADAAVERLARFEALQAHFRRQDANIWGWPAWPAEYRDPDGPAVAAFVAAHADAVDCQAWLQWQADNQLAEAGRLSWRRGLGIGLYADFAVGVNPGGADTWGWQGVYANGAYTGAPPEAINLNGQDWGLPPLIPQRLRQAAYAPLIEALRANMRHAGALRIDHVMSLTRLFWVPAGGSPRAGAYVRYPLDEMLGIVALESQRNQCLVIGEDLGTVPAGFRDRLAAARLLSYRPLVEERAADGSFLAPAEFPDQALVAVSTHDMPTLAGFWQGSDLDVRSALALFPGEEQRTAMVVGRAQDRARLLVALEQERLLPAGGSIHPVAVPEISLPYALAIHAYLARSPARVLVVQPEDILGTVEQANLPGTLDHQHPNWRRRLVLDLEAWPADERFSAFGEMLRRERGSAVTPHDAATEPRVALIPRATYRLQFNKDFGFDAATALIPYLAALGVSHVYASPYLRARSGSGHGYDIVDHARLNPEIGTPEAFERFVAALAAHGMGQILDVVPNHMGVMGADNAWWLDVLENGPAAAHGDYFDIDWQPLNPALQGKVLLPLLGDHYGAVLNRGELQLQFDAATGELSLYYWQHRLPLDPVTYPRVIGRQIARLGGTLGEEDSGFSELQSLLTAFARLPGRMAVEPERRAERQRDKEVHKRHLAALYMASPAIAEHIAANLAELNGQPGMASSFDALHELIQAQGYRLAYWRVASDEINYRRFFDINDLAALRMEDDAVFAATHRLILDLVRQGKVDGLRIDHPDGLYDPGAYFRRLQAAAQGGAFDPVQPLPLYLVIEKILAEHEQLPPDWPIHGATGYRFANLANNLFVDAAAARRMTRIYDDFIGTPSDFEALVYIAKKLIMETALASELAVLAHRLARIAARDRDTCDFTLNGLKDALTEIVACFPVYRSYVNASGLSADDRRHIEWAVAVARKKSPTADPGIYAFVQDVLTTDLALGCDADDRQAVIAFAMKFQQFSSPVMAKGVEDTSFYRYLRLTSLNDVGGEPKRFGISVAGYHAATRERIKRWPHNLLATSTHDSKRSEDVRCRIDVLSEMPAHWKLMLKRWRLINRGRKREIDGLAAPSANDEVLLYQTLLGSWPLDDAPDLEAYRARITAYMNKAIREAKTHSSWVNVNADYEVALADFIAALLAPGDKNLFLADFVPQARRIAHHGLLNSLALTLLKLTAPGVPDIYQGCELWQFTLVDPDNRHPVDYDLRRQLLDRIDRFDLASPLADPRHKLALIRRTLALRAAAPELFRDGDYLPLAVKGERANHVCAYARRWGDQAIVAVIPRLTYKLLGEAGGLPLGDAVWQDTALDLPTGLRDRPWKNLLTGASGKPAGGFMLSEVLASYPVALLQVM